MSFRGGGGGYNRQSGGGGGGRGFGGGGRGGRGINVEILPKMLFVLVSKLIVLLEPIFRW